MRYLLTSVAFILVSSAAYAVPALRAPAPEMDLGLAGLAMVAAAAFLTRRRRS
jgi:LPXTG-motif cell wall-anchored protein